MLRPVASGIFRLRPRWSPEEKARWKRKLIDPLTLAFALSVGFLLAVAAVLGLRVFQNRREVALLRIEYQAHLKDRAEKDDAVRQELDTMYRTLYASPVPSTEVRKPSAVEQWQVNRDKELRERIRQLELWRSRQER